MVAIETIKKTRRRRLKLLVVLLLCMQIFITSCTDEQVEDSISMALDIIIEVLENPEQETEAEHVTIAVEGQMTVHFIDVGQADATLIVHDGHAMLFDAATKSRGDELVEYINALGIEYIDVLVLSHPHDDHMGGSAKVLNNIEVGKIYGPDIFNLAELEELGWYDDMTDAIDRIDAERNVNIPEEKQTSIWHFPRNEKGEFAKFNIGDAIVEFYAPLEDEYSDKNDYSICAKVTFGEVDVFFTGDATSSVEEALIAEEYDLDIEVFQAAHHGSYTGNSKNFLEAMSPEAIVISCGMKNKYNHPSKSVIQLYEKMNIPVYRTDESGTIIMTTDGIEYSFNKEQGTYISGEEYKTQGD